MDSDDDRYQRINLRLPKELHAQLMTAARTASRSMNAEIISRLEADPAKPKSWTELENYELRCDKHANDVQRRAFALVLKLAEERTSLMNMFSHIIASPGMEPSAKAELDKLNKENMRQLHFAITQMQEWVSDPSFVQSLTGTLLSTSHKAVAQTAGSTQHKDAAPAFGDDRPGESPGLPRQDRSREQARFSAKSTEPQHQSLSPARRDLR